MQRADDRLVGAYSGTVRAVTEREARGVRRPRGALTGLEAEGGEHRLQSLVEREVDLARDQLAPELASGGFDLAQATGAGGGRAGEPGGERGVRVRALAAPRGCGAERPGVTRAPARLADAPALYETGRLEALEVDAYAAAMQSEERRQLLGGGRSLQLTEHIEEPRTRRYAEGRRPIGRSPAHPSAKKFAEFK
jgi:hypothetical protein